MFNNLKPKRASVKGALLAAIALVAVAASISPAMATPIPFEPPDFDPGINNPHTWFVSKNGNNADGKSWATAWTDFDQIQWNQIQYTRHDKIEIDGGVSRMVYRTPLRIAIPQSQGYVPFSISVSKSTAHNGQAVLIAPPGSRAVEIINGPVTLDGSKRSGLLIVGGREGVAAHSESISAPNTIKNLEIAHCSEAGFYYGSGNGYPTQISQTIIHDCKTNVLAVGAGYLSGGNFDKCWVYNSTYRPNSDGFRQEAPSSGGMFVVGFTIRNSVIGPGLRDGVSEQANAVPMLRDCLFINATRSNVLAQTAYLDNITSFMTRLNPLQKVHSAIRFYPGQQLPSLIGAHVNNSIVYGGMVDIPLTVPFPPYPDRPFPITSSNNTQFATTGNTAVLSPSFVDPQFVSDVRRLSNQTPVFMLMNLDFSLRPTSPALSTGSAVTSIRRLLDSFN